VLVGSDSASLHFRRSVARDAAEPRSRAASKRQQSIIDYYDAAQRSGEHLLAPPTQAAAIHLST